MMRQLFDRIRYKNVMKHVIMQEIAPIISELPIWEGKNQAFRVRLATEADIPTFLSLEEDAYEGFLAWRRKDFESDWHHNPYCVYIMVEDIIKGEVIGMISGRFLARGAHVSHLLVRKAYQRQKIGQRLLALWLDLVKQRRIPQVTLEVRKSNQAAINLYYNAGFEKLREIPNYYSDNKETALYLKHQIDLNEG